MMATSNLDQYEKLNDSIFLEILNSNHPDLEESKKILELISKRKLYKYVGSCVLPNDADISVLEQEVIKII